MIKFALMENRYNDYSPEFDYNDNLSNETVEVVAERVQSTVKARVKDKYHKNSKQKKKQSTTQPDNNSLKDKLLKLVNAQSLRLVLGILLGCISVYLLVSFISYIGDCVKDQSIINSNPIGYAKNIHNAGGEGGARLSEFLINESFGAGSFVIILWFAAMSLKQLTGLPKFKSVNFTIKCFVALITISLIVGLSTVWTHSYVNWGGYHARYIYQFIEDFTGTTGSVLICIFMVALFTVICLRDLINWIEKKHAIRVARREEQERILAEERAKEEAKAVDTAADNLDDIRSGESLEKETETIMNLSVEENSVSFSDDDNIDEDERPLYTLDTFEEASDLDRNLDCENVISNTSDKSDLATSLEDADDTKNDEGCDIPKSFETTLPHNDSDKYNTEELPQTDASSDIEEDVMTVNVNQIGECNKRHYKSQKDFESRHPYNFPPFTLLKPGVEKISVDAEEQLENKSKIKQTLLDFGIPITDIKATVGPTVTLYEIVPDKGVKIAKIRSLVDDIALSLSATGVRIIAPIPGKGTVGIEVANKDALTVSMQTIIRSKKYQESKYILPIAIGSTISNDVYIADLAKMPHLLVAGATGQGKSVGLNAIITSLLYCKSPSDLKFVMIDPKQVEFSLYNKLKNYYMAVIPEDADSPEPVITDMKKVEATLNSLCIEMDDRYTLLKNAHARNIEEYNSKIKEGKLDPREGHRFLPYIVVVVDEFGDLMMVSGKNVELPIARLAQKARAVGMHVIIATQRPSTNVITGIIKANFPARISFKVSSGVDSKTILDTTGAQHLIGRGDMLIFNNSEMVRVQCAFIDTPEVEEICEYIEKQPYPCGVYELPEPQVSTEEGSGALGTPVGERDVLLEEVARRVVAAGTASTSSVQRSYSIGYNRAGKIMDQLEAIGIVGPASGGKPRAVLVDNAELENILSSL